MIAEEIKRAKDLEGKKRRKAERKAQRAGLAVGPVMPDMQEVPAAHKTSVPASTPKAFVFPGQGSQAVGMLQVLLLCIQFCKHICAVCSCQALQSHFMQSVSVVCLV